MTMIVSKSKQKQQATSQMKERSEKETERERIILGFWCEGGGRAQESVTSCMTN